MDQCVLQTWICHEVERGKNHFYCPIQPKKDQRGNESSSRKNVTHAHKYKCPTTSKTKYCNAIFNKKATEITNQASLL